MAVVDARRNEVVKNVGDTVRATNRILITGACGFIGSHLTDRLMEDPHNEVIAVDNCFSGDKRNLQKWFGNPRFEFIRHDVCLPLTVEVDQIYHLACPASPVFYQHNPIKTVKTAFQGTLNMCGLAKRVKARLLLASTSEVYGDPEVHPQVETYFGNVNSIGIRSCYDEGKRVSETLCFEYHRLHQTDIRVARIFNTYGPRMLENDGRVVSNFIVQALKGIPLTVYGDGSQTRSFCFVGDLVDGLIKLMRGSDIGPVNLGNPGEYTIKELAEKVQGLVNPAVPVAFKPLPSDDPTRRKPDITRAKQNLGWEPKVPLEKGLRLTIEDFKTRVHGHK
ncbi:UDP-glucuronate decarboxylase [Plasmodiophora brassicae]